MILERTELKYLIPIDIYPELSRDLKTYLKPDSNTKDGRIRYDVHSIYYDTPNFKYYNDKVDGEEIRKKFRIRYYGDKDILKNNDVWFEIKDKYGPVIKKTRYNRTLNDNLDELTFEDQTNPHATKVSYLYNKNILNPVVRVSYKREALVAIYESDTRVTFDSEMTGSFVNTKATGETGRDIKLISDFLYLLEIKTSDSIPTWLSHIIEKYNLEQTSYSKYAKAIENTGALRRLKGEFYGF